jgi:hypothetical protein
VLALALAPGLLLPGSASATPRGRCHIDLSVQTSSLTAGEPAALSGSVSCPDPTETAEQTITIYQHEAGASGSSAVGTATPEASGSYRFTTEALTANSVFFARAQGARSARISVTVAPIVTLAGPPAGTQLYIAGHHSAASARESNTVTFAGKVSPAEGGTRVMLQREGQGGAEDWSQVALGEVAADGTYSITHTFTVPGTIDVRAVVRRAGALPGISEQISYELAPRQNSQLTIGAEPRPLSYGQSVLVSGTAAGEAHQLLTLLASTRGGAFAPIATATSGSGGSYSFAAQSPVENTVYKVSDAHAISTSLFEGVHPALTAAVSSTSLAAGEPLKLTGTLTPAHAGELVELQRQSADGLGFHVVEVGAVGPGGSYAIEHTVFGQGTQVFRIKVTGDAALQGAASELFKIQVTPASEPSLEPRAPVSEAPASGEG